jgi:hypothetical protein
LRKEHAICPPDRQVIGPASPLRTKKITKLFQRLNKKSGKPRRPAKKAYGETGSQIPLPHPYSVSIAQKALARRGNIALAGDSSHYKGAARLAERKGFEPLIRL